MSCESTDIREQAVLAAAMRLVDAFSRHDTAAYFQAFAPNASFIFYSHAEILASRADYELLWKAWERDSSFNVLSCQSSEQSVQLVGDAALFTHQVRTKVRTYEGEVTLDERETIVFAQALNGAWVAVHEHLSPLPKLMDGHAK